MKASWECGKTMTTTSEPPANRVIETTAERTEPLYPLTSLRFFGSLAVFFFHAIDVCKREAQTVVFGSASAVSLFFVLSGFILVYIYQKKLPELGTWGFYAKRIARLWPLHFVCLILVLIFQNGVLTYPQMTDSREFWAKLGLNLVMLHNLVPSADWALSFNGVSWFVGTEFCFCLLFPLLARGGKKSIGLIWLATFLMLASGLTVANRILATNPEWLESIYIMIQCNPLFRLFEFTSGMLVGYIVLGGNRLPSGRLRFVWHTLFEAIAIAFLVISLHQGPLAQWLFRFCSEQGWRTTVAWLGKGGSSLPASMVLIWVLASSRGPLAALLSQPLLVFLGKLSFSFYMIHSLILHVIVKLCPPEESPTVMILGGLALSIAAASLLNLLVENPFRSLLVGVLDRKQKRSGETSFTAQPWNRMVYSTMVAGLIGLLGYWALWSESSRDLTAPPAEQRQIVFGESAILHFVDANMRGDHLEIVLVWEKRSKFKATRFGHIIDPDEKFRHLPTNSKLFDLGRIAVERILISRAELEGALAVGVGLFEDGKSVMFTNRTRTFSGWRVTVFDLKTNTVPKNVKDNTKVESIIKRWTDTSQAGSIISVVCQIPPTSGR
jgi:peptidoglycan/LPS O-acetylase OafA/YrhL